MKQLKEKALSSRFNWSNSSFKVVEFHRVLTQNVSMKWKQANYVRDIKTITVSIFQEKESGKTHFVEYIKIDRDKSTFKSHRDFSYITYHTLKNQLNVKRQS